MGNRDFKVSVTKLLSHPGEPLEVELAGLIGDQFVSSAWVEEGSTTHLSGSLEAVHSGVMFSGVAKVNIVTECRRCLCHSKADLVVEIRELFESDYKEDEGDTYPIHGEFVDLEEMVRDAVVLALPPAPLCKEECAGLCVTCGVDKNLVSCGHDNQGRDPRFSILDQLR
ncbi:DUF177 domain-containing protein [Acidithrix sp. C25]|uniref:YceD family protein n=1 Tax=Acidithrix sp. C25 TaxID=1671482 RepID=UPI00191BBEA8|nr:DUF177 domain-containing protein [Acidithrix sp. C25]CAG4904355.1 unnamed protein product [Acidithrix sp. C25]